MNQTQERPGISLDDAPECWDLPEKEPEVYWEYWFFGLKIKDPIQALNRPDGEFVWYALTEQDAIRRISEFPDRTLSRTEALTPKECTAKAIKLGREGVGIYTYEGDEKVCVRYWLVGDPVRI